MSTRYLVVDPTGLRDLTDRQSARYAWQIDSVSGSLLAQIDMDDLLFHQLAAMALNNMLMDVLWATEATMHRAILRASAETELLDPNFVVHDFQWLPVDETNVATFQADHKRYLTDLMDDLRDDVTRTVTQGQQQGLDWDAISRTLQDVFALTKQRADKIARTELMKDYNETARQRYQMWGVEAYTFHAHLDACHEPKTLPDGSVAREGCLGLHGQAFPVTDTVHRPPIHPLCRCTILPSKRNL